MDILKPGKPRVALFVCTWCGTEWRATTSEKGVYKYNMLGQSYPRMHCPLCSEKYVVGQFVDNEDVEDEEC